MSCPACGGPTEAWITASCSEPADNSSYELSRCRNCGTALTAGGPPTADAYERGIYGGQEPRLGSLVAVLQRAVLWMPMKLLARAGVVGGARVLDAGAGKGRLVAALRARGYAAEGIDAAPRAAGVRRAEINDHETSDLDAVVLWHVLEHLPEPRAALDRVRQWLRPEGVLLVGVPNLSSLQARIAGPDWFHLDLPRHRTHFTVTGLSELMEQSGFKTERVRQLVPEHNFHGMWFALLSRVGMSPGFPFQLVKRNTPVGLRDVVLLAVAGPLLLVPALALEVIAAATGRGGSVAIVARVQSDA